MPMYEFACRACGAEFEELCTLAEMEQGDVTCPECGAEKKAERRMSTFASTGGDASSGFASGPPCGSSGFG